jgi:hypothetical protein
VAEISEMRRRCDDARAIERLRTVMQMTAAVKLASAKRKERSASLLAAIHQSARDEAASRWLDHMSSHSFDPAFANSFGAYAAIKATEWTMAAAEAADADRHCRQVGQDFVHATQIADEAKRDAQTAARQLSTAIEEQAMRRVEDYLCHQRVRGKVLER